MQHDITDMDNITELDRVQSSPGQNVIPHNTFVLNDYLVTSYYVDGITIHDAKHPQNLIEVAAYDTYPGQTPTYDGSWGVYPYLPSGIILASDRSEGLYILQPDYQRASYLEGTITNQNDGNPIGNVSVDIVGNNQENLSSSVGFYATGMPAAGTYDVTYFKVGYESQTISTEISQGNITVQDVALAPITPFSLLVNVEDIFGNPIQNAKIKLEHPLITYEGETNGLGQEVFSLFYEDLHSLQVGKWGYITECYEDFSLLLDAGTATLTVVLQNGNYDDFTFDFGWTVSGGVTSPNDGIWQRGNPEGTDYNGSNFNPENDISNDCYDYAYVTGLESGSSVGDRDVDDANTILTSPIFDLSSSLNNQKYYLNYNIWFNNDFPSWGGGTPANDSITVKITNGVFVSTLDVITSNSPNLGQWNSKSFDLSQYISLNNTMQIIIETADWDFLDGHWVEGGFDKFEITSQAPSLISNTINENRELVKVVDLLGKTSNFKANSLIFYIYDDGSVEKKIAVK